MSSNIFHKITPKKHLGQNFFTSEKYINLLVKTADFKKDELIIEIGPGTGAITDSILKIGANIIAIEKDKNLTNLLKEKYQNTKNIEIICSDILEIDLDKITKKRSYKIISNIPHYITGKIIRKILELKNKPVSITFSLQKEVAEKIAKRGEYKNKESLLSLIIQLFGTVSFITKIPAGAFYPKPKTDSAIILITSSKKTSDKNRKDFTNFLKNGFSSPRKKVITNLSKGLKIKKDYLIKILNELGFSENTRPENLNLNDWQNLFQKLYK